MHLTWIEVGKSAAHLVKSKQSPTSMSAPHHVYGGQGGDIKEILSREEVHSHHMRVERGIVGAGQAAWKGCTGVGKSCPCAGCQRSSTGGDRYPPLCLLSFGILPLHSIHLV